MPVEGDLCLNTSLFRLFVISQQNAIKPSGYLALGYLRDRDAAFLLCDLSAIARRAIKKGTPAFGCTASNRQTTPPETVWNTSYLDDLILPSISLLCFVLREFASRCRRTEKKSISLEALCYKLCGIWSLGWRKSWRCGKCNDDVKLDDDL